MGTAEPVSVFARSIAAVLLRGRDRDKWSTALPAGGQSSPMTYVSPSSGRQFVLIAAAGHRILQSPTGDAIVAYALPRKN